MPSNLMTGLSQRIRQLHKLASQRAVITLK